MASTGDAALIDNNNDLHIQGRIKNRIKLKETTVFLPIEQKW